MNNKTINRDNEYKFYQEFGEFVVNYEIIISTIKTGILSLMHLFNNDAQIYQPCLHILLSEMPSIQLIHKYGALIKNIFGENIKFPPKKIDLCIQSILKLNEARNNLIHRNYLIGYNTENYTFDTSESSNPKAKKSGLDHRFMQIGYKELKIINTYSKELKKLLDWISAGFLFGTQVTSFIEYDEEIIKKMKKEFEKYES